jgi:hypothetical protein
MKIEVIISDDENKTEVSRRIDVSMSDIEFEKVDVQSHMNEISSHISQQLAIDFQVAFEQFSQKIIEKVAPNG